jgi:hypothetical protein
VLARDQHRALHLGADAGNAAQDLAPIERDNAFDPIRLGMGEQLRQAGLLRLRPGSHDGRSFDQRQVEAFSDTQIGVVTLAHAGEFQAAFRCIVAGM